MSEHPGSWRDLLGQAGQPAGHGEVPDMRLASAGDVGAGIDGAGGVLRQSRMPWRSASGVARGFGRSMSTAKEELGTSHGKLKVGTEGLSSIAVLAAVRESWETRLGDAQAECASLDVKLRNVAAAHNENDHAVQGSFAKLGEQGAEAVGRGQTGRAGLVNGMSLPPDQGVRP
ncbi:hypothetical protein [Streptomyces iconiensis]|uniref:Uncharacterized protein n=1 Tax=Streptomyces iconiensis TaxID=1384038 RepID=A0ABT6ZZC5_9ACTN|nr:hypothetical protein [Streptomyces iconiensis]MDJ1134423.1 hypothetical protein [Streptomyces iconiensis]